MGHVRQGYWECGTRLSAQAFPTGFLQRCTWHMLRSQTGSTREPNSQRHEGEKSQFDGESDRACSEGTSSGVFDRDRVISRPKSRKKRVTLTLTSRSSTVAPHPTYLLHDTNRFQPHIGCVDAGFRVLQCMATLWQRAPAEGALTAAVFLRAV